MSAPVRPAIGARMVAYCSCTFAFSTAALFAPTDGVERGGSGERGITLFACADPALDEVFHSLRDHLRVGGLRCIARQVRFGLAQRRFEWPVIEREKNLSGLHVVALREVDIFQLARHLGTDGDSREGLDRADDVHVERHFLLDDEIDRDRHRLLR